MKVYITMDMEGISGICTGDMARSGSAEWANRGRHLATGDVNAAVEGALAGGAELVVVNDAHDSGENIVREDLNPKADLIIGWPNISGYMPDLDDTFDVVFLIGFHARMGTRFAHFDHSVSTASINEIHLNGDPIGEIGIYTVYAGTLGVPVVLVTGDVAATEESKDLIGTVETVAVKQGLGRFAARVFPPEEMQANIRAAAERAMSLTGAPYQAASPMNWAVKFLRSAEADMAQMVPGSMRTGPRTVEYTHEDPQMAFLGLQSMINLGGIAARRWASGLFTKGNPVI
jgi:D-amino peptidase